MCIETRKFIKKQKHPGLVRRRCVSNDDAKKTTKFVSCNYFTYFFTEKPSICNTKRHFTQFLTRDKVFRPDKRPGRGSMPRGRDAAL